MNQLTRRSDDTATPSASFHQKSAGVSLAVLIAVALSYGARLITLPPSPEPLIAEQLW